MAVVNKDQKLTHFVVVCKHSKTVVNFDLKIQSTLMLFTVRTYCYHRQ